MTETNSDSFYPKIDITKNQYDQNTYIGRVKYFYKVTNPLTLFVTKKELEGAVKLLSDFQNRKLTKPVTEKELWRAKNIKEAILHPDTQEPIPALFRMSAFVPANLLIIAGMLQARAIAPTVFWQTVNQTYNVGLNSANSNKSTVVPRNVMMVNFAAALTTSVGVAVGLNEWVKRTTRFTPAMKNILLKYVPFTAVVAANICSIGLLRKGELFEGIKLRDEEGKKVGQSVIAGRQAVGKTILTRIILNIPAMFIPPTIIAFLERRPWFPKTPVGVTGMNLVVIAATLLCALPWAIGLFPQETAIHVDKLEKEFQGLTTKSGKKIEYLYFNKGL